MQNRILYFPSLNPPQNDWFLIASLFYEKILFIAPPAYLIDGRIDVKYMPFFQDHSIQLYEKGYIEYISSFESSRDELIFAERFYGSMKFIINNRERFKKELISGNTSRILRGKFTEELIHELDKLDLVNRIDINPNQWPYFDFYIPKSIGDVLMYELALMLGELERCVLSTDKQEYVFSFENATQQSQHTQLYWKLVLSRVFPVPMNYSLEEILNFKETYGNELIHYKNYLDDKINDLSYIKPEEMESYLTSQFQQIDTELKRLVELYKDAGYDRFIYKDYANIFKLVRGILGKNIVNIIQGVFGLANRNQIPEIGNSNTFPAMYNYKFIKNTME